MYIVFGIIALSLAGVLGDFFIKLAGNGSKFMDVKWFIVGLVVYVAAGVGWFFALKYIKMSSLGVIYSMATLLFLILVGVFFFQEKLNPYELIGIILAVVSIFLLSRFA